MADLRGLDRIGEREPVPGKLVERELTGQVIGAFYTVYNQLRHGFLETVYAGALEYELRALDLPYVREMQLDVRYKGTLVGCYRADFVIAGTLVLELKASHSVGVPDRRQLLNYLRATELQVGLLLHFGPEATFTRVVNSRNHSNAI
jgi:GxxExxY protein